jgi:polyhydroxyalkanoate synthesis regulator phasin
MKQYILSQTQLNKLKTEKQKTNQKFNNEIETLTDKVDETRSKKKKAIQVFNKGIETLEKTLMNFEEFCSTP